jgi:UDP-N-acetylglucosamine 2-epimerase (non-hydrolysing)
VTLRENTERPETIDTGSNILAGTNPEMMLAAVIRMIDSTRGWKNPFGNGDAARRIVNECRKRGTL